MKDLKNLIGKKVRGFKFKGYYNPDMDSYIGEVGVIEDLIEDAIKAKVRFQDGGYWWYPVNEISQHLVEDEKTYPVTRKQLSEIYNSVCDKWKSKINTIIDNGGRFSESFEVPQSLIWKARAEANTEQYQWIVRAFGEVKKELTKEDYKDRTWYKSSKTGSIFFLDKSSRENYGFSDRWRDGLHWFENFNQNYFHVVGYWIEATPQEVEKVLIEEAKRRYKVGDKLSKVYDDCSKGDRIFSLSLSHQSGLCDLWIDNDGDRGHSSCIFKDGQWATVIKQDKIEVGDWAYLEEHGFKKVREESQAKALSNKGWSKVTDEQVLEVLNNYKID